MAGGEWDVRCLRGHFHFFYNTIKRRNIAEECIPQFSHSNDKCMDSNMEKTSE